jgi:cysteine synthase A
MVANYRPGATVLEAIGSTPLIQVDGIFVKLEYLNPSGSIKARMARYIIERAEREGLLRPGDTIVEASSGNTGNAMSMVAAVLGYKMLVVMPDGLSPERAAISLAFGAEMLRVGTFHVNEALEVASRLGDQPGYFAPHQFESEWNVEENRTWLGPEILGQLPTDVSPDAFVMGVGTGGTLIGVGQAFREVGVHSDDAVKEMRRLASEHGLLVGPSSGANMVVARRIRDELGDGANVVTILCDEGEKYLTEYFIPASI